MTIDSKITLFDRTNNELATVVCPTTFVLRMSLILWTGIEVESPCEWEMRFRDTHWPSDKPHRPCSDEAILRILSSTIQQTLHSQTVRPKETLWICNKKRRWVRPWLKFGIIDFSEFSSWANLTGIVPPKIKFKASMTKFSSNPEVRAQKPACCSLKTPFLSSRYSKHFKKCKKKTKSSILP